MIDLKKGLIVVDFDGTLYNTSRANYYAYKEAMSTFGYDLNKELYFQKYEGTEYSFFLSEFTKDEKIQQNIHEYKKGCYAKYYDKIVENSFLLDILATLKKDYYIAILTNATRKNCIEILNYWNRKEQFDYIVAGDDVAKRKPSKEGLMKIMRYFKKSREETLVIEDDIENLKKDSGISFLLCNFANKI